MKPGRALRTEVKYPGMQLNEIQQRQTWQGREETASHCCNSILNLDVQSIICPLPALHPAGANCHLKLPGFMETTLVISHSSPHFQPSTAVPKAKK